MKMGKSIYIGVMTGTSCDAIDVSFITVNQKVNLEFFHSIKIPKKNQTEIKNLIESSEISLSSLGKINKEIGEMYSRAIEKSILLSGVQKKDIKSIALSGQTVWHEINRGKGFSMQLGDPNIVAADLNIPVIDNLRGMHIAIGGQGAPLVPEFHHNIFYKKNKKSLVVNIGGISNFTYIKNKNDFFGSDIGPGNALMDAYCQKNLDRPFDKNGSLFIWSLIFWSDKTPLFLAICAICITCKAASGALRVELNNALLTILNTPIISLNEKQTVVIAAVPPRTIKIAGRFIKVPGEPPKNIAKATRKKAMVIPMIVARSIDLRTGEMRKVSESAISLPYSLLV